MFLHDKKKEPSKQSNSYAKQLAITSFYDPVWVSLQHMHADVVQLCSTIAARQNCFHVYETWAGKQTLQHPVPQGSSVKPLR